MPTPPGAGKENINARGAEYVFFRQGPERCPKLGTKTETYNISPEKGAFS